MGFGMFGNSDRLESSGRHRERSEGRPRAAACGSLCRRRHPVTAEPHQDVIESITGFRTGKSLRYFEKPQKLARGRCRKRLPGRRERRRPRHRGALASARRRGSAGNDPAPDGQKRARRRLLSAEDMGPAAARRAEAPPRAAVMIAGDGPGDCQSQPPPHPQRRLAGDFEPQMQLVSADRTIRGGQQKTRLKPFVQWHMAALEQGPERRAKLFAAAATEFRPLARALADRGDPISLAAMRTDRTLRPHHRFELAARCLLVAEVGVGNAVQIDASR